MSKTPSFGIITIVLASLLLLASCLQTDSESSDQSSKQEIIVLAATSLTDALEEIKIAFEQQVEGIKLLFSFGSSGNLAQQIEHGAPADLFLAASSVDMDSLQEKDLIIEETRTDFARNELVLIARKESSLNITSFADLDAQGFSHLAIGNPESVPVGSYTQQVFEHLGIWDELQPKLVFASDVRQVLTYVETGNVDVGVVYASDALVSEQVHIVARADKNWHTPIIYPGAIIKSSKHKEAGQAFLTFLSGSEGQAILAKYGFISN